MNEYSDYYTREPFNLVGRQIEWRLLNNTCNFVRDPKLVFLAHLMQYSMMD